MNNTTSTFSSSQWMELFGQDYIDPARNLKKYQEIMTIPGVSKNFGNWIFSTQHQFVRWSHETFGNELLAAMAKLWIEGGTDYPIEYDWRNPVYVQTRDWESEWRAWDNTGELRELVKKFSYFQSDLPTPNDYMWAEINLIAVFQLLKIYGRPTVSEVLSAWTNNHASREIHHLVEIVERWSELKNYPIEWAVGLLD